VPQSLSHPLRERREQAAVPLLARADQLLGVPLDGEEPPAVEVRGLDALDDAVRGAGRDAQRSFFARAHLGNYALWLSGLFPDFVESRRWRRGGPDLDYYEDMGRRGYKLAADHRLAAEHGLAPLFSAAADRFALLRLALNSISDSLLFPNHSSPDRLMRQVRDEARWRLQ